MRLIDVRTLELVESATEQNLPYAILSHRWEDEEVSYHDMMNNKKVDRMAGYDKIRKCCAKAWENNLTYAWVDTCCIDKSSSAELQEAINSMCRWYQNAYSCYIYLSDVSSRTPDDLTCSQWFSRGWTLQELIAPRYAEIFNRSWQLIGTRENLAMKLSSITRIPPALLEGKVQRLSQYSIAERMSWARGRKTTRIEDRAYSLLGLFDVNMPMLYGEGHKAFIRLQEEILRKSFDQSILAWTGVREGSYDLLARSPDDFPQQSAGKAWNSPVSYQRRGSHAITNEGLEIELEITPWKPNIYLAILNYGLDHLRHPATTQIDRSSAVKEGIFIRRLDSRTKQYFIRVIDEDLGDLYRGPLGMSQRNHLSDGTHTRSRPFQLNRVTIVQSLIENAEGAQLSSSPFPGFKIHDPASWYHTDNDKIFSLKPGESGSIAILDSPVTSVRAAVLGFDFDYRVVVVLQMDRHRHARFAPASEVTCLESYSNLLVPWRVYSTTADRLNDDDLPYWIFKFSDEHHDVGAYQCDIYLGGAKDGDVQAVSLTVWRQTKTLPWNFYISESYDRLRTSVAESEAINSWYICRDVSSNFPFEL